MHTPSSKNYNSKEPTQNKAQLYKMYICKQERNKEKFNLNYIYFSFLL